LERDTLLFAKQKTHYKNTLSLFGAQSRQATVFLELFCNLTS